MPRKKKTCVRCKENLGESWLEPCFGKYRGKPLCRKCDEECRSHKLYILRQRISVHALSVKIFLELLIGDFLKFFLKRVQK
jgi:hypothetical protein